MTNVCPDSVGLPGAAAGSAATVSPSHSSRAAADDSISPTWEGDQVWFILGGGAIFAAWPFVYTVSFSGFYLAVFLVLSAVILRPIDFKYRSKRSDPDEDLTR